LLLLLAGPSSSAAAAQPAAGLAQAQQFSKDVEDEANSYFQRIYNTSGSSQHSAITIVEQVLEMLKNFKDSPSDRDKVRDVYRAGCAQCVAQLNVLPNRGGRESILLFSQDGFWEASCRHRSHLATRAMMLHHDVYC